MPGLEIFAQGLIERRDRGWAITDAGRAALDFMEAWPPQSQITAPEPPSAIPAPASLVIAGSGSRIDRRRRCRKPTRQRQTASAS